MEEVREHPHLSWYRNGLSCNRGITISDIETLELPNATGQWNWYNLSMYISMNEVRRNPHLPWNKSALASNKDITVRDIEYITLDRIEHLMRDIIPYVIVDKLHDVIFVL